MCHWERKGKTIEINCNNWAHFFSDDEMLAVYRLLNLKLFINL